MSFHRLIIPFIILSLTKSSKSFAFDPFTASMATSSIMDKIDEASNVGFALTDLLTEVGIQNDGDKDLNQAIDQLNSFQSQSRDAQWTTEDFNHSLNMTLENGQNLEKRMNALKNTVQASKKIASIMGFRPKAAESAVKIQEIRISSMMLEELQSIRKAQYLAYLANENEKIKREIYIQKILHQSDQERRNKP